MTEPPTKVAQFAVSVIRRRIKWCMRFGQLLIYRNVEDLHCSELEPDEFLYFHYYFLSSPDELYFCSYYYFALFYFISFHFISFHFISFHFISFHFISFHFISFYFILFYFISFYFILFYFILFYFILFYLILFYFILLFFPHHHVPRFGEEKRHTKWSTKPIT